MRTGRRRWASCCAGSAASRASARWPRTDWGIPAHRDLRGAWEKSWDTAGVDVSAIEVPRGRRPARDRGPLGDRGTAMPIIAEVFPGETDAAEALPRAQEAAREAMA